MADVIETPQAEEVRVQILQRIQEMQNRLGETNPKRLVSSYVAEARTGSTQAFCLRHFSEYNEKICFLKRANTLDFQCVIEKEGALKDILEETKEKYRTIGFDLRTPESPNGCGCFAGKVYEGAKWKNGLLDSTILDEIVEDFTKLIEITQPFEEMFTLVNSRSSSSGRKKSASRSVTLETDILEAWNRIYFGAPGTGKSHQLKQDVEAKFGKNFERVTFYPTYSYQQFVGAYKPFVKKIVEKNNQGQDVVRDEITYKFVPGPLMRLLVKAWKAEEGYRQALKKLEDLNSEEKQDIEAIKKANRFVLIVEELNRAEAAAVFGDFFQLLDRGDNGESVYKISIPEELKARLEEEGVTQEELYLPANFYIWATMNNADQGVTPLDTAFKRRWDFEYIGLDDGAKALKGKEEMFWNNLRESINAGLRKLPVNEDKLLGPFFMRPTAGMSQDSFWKLFCDKVVLYLYEDAARLRRKDCFKKANVTYSELREAFTKSITDLETCKKVLSGHFNFEMTLSVPWPWSLPPETDSKNNASESNASAEDASGETSGAQGESTSDNL